MHLIKTILLVLFILPYIACSDKRKEKKQIAIVDSAKIDLNIIVADIAKHPTVDEEHVGFVGTASQQYERFLKLKKHASQNELIELMNHASANVRAYAFWALAKTKYAGIDSLMKRKATDTAAIRHFSGCTIIQYPIPDFYASIIGREQLSQKK